MDRLLIPYRFTCNVCSRLKAQISKGVEQEDITLLRERGKRGRRRQMTRAKYTRTYVEIKRMKPTFIMLKRLTKSSHQSQTKGMSYSGSSAVCTLSLYCLCSAGRGRPAGVWIQSYQDGKRRHHRRRRLRPGIWVI